MRAQGLALTLCALLSASAPAAEPLAAPETIALQSRPFALEARRLAGTKARYLGGFVLSSAERRFGGISGALWLDGELIAATDRGAWLRFDPRRDPATGRILAAEKAVIGAILGRSGVRLRGRGRDAESLARDPAGGIWIAFEGDHRLTRRETLEGPAVAEATALPSEILPFNSGIEALATAPDGALWALAEGLIGPGGAIQGWRMTNGRADPFTVRPLRGYQPTGADFGPDGALYLLERRYDFFSGVRVRARRFSAEIVAAAPSDLGEGEILFELDQRAKIDNMEAIAVEPAPGGGALLTLLSDDNFSDLQQTLLLQFVVP